MLTCCAAVTATCMLSPIQARIPPRIQWSLCWTRTINGHIAPLARGAWGQDSGCGLEAAGCGREGERKSLRPTARSQQLAANSFFEGRVEGGLDYGEYRYQVSRRHGDYQWASARRYCQFDTGGHVL